MKLLEYGKFTIYDLYKNIEDYQDDNSYETLRIVGHVSREDVLKRLTKGYVMGVISHYTHGRMIKIC